LENFMNKSWTPLEEVRLFWDKKNNTVKVTSSDPRLEGESFVLQLSPRTRADELARRVLAEAGIDTTGTSGKPENVIDPYQAALLESAKDLTTRPPLPTNDNPFQIIIGHDYLKQSVHWHMPSQTSEIPKSLGIFGATGQGKSILLTQILDQIAQYPEIFDVYFYDAKSSVSASNLQYSESITTLTEDFSTLMRGASDHSKMRVIIIDGYTYVADQAGQLLRQARSQNDIIIFTSQVVDQSIINLCNAAVVIGKSTLRQRIALDIDRLGVQARGQGVLVKTCENNAAQEFYTYAPRELKTAQVDPVKELDAVFRNVIPRQLSTHPYVIPLGSQGTDPGDRVDWDLRYYNPGNRYPAVLGIFGAADQGKTLMSRHIIAHALAFPNDIELYVCSTRPEEAQSLAASGIRLVTPEDLEHLPAPAMHKRRLIVLDSLDDYMPEKKTVQTSREDLARATQADHMRQVILNAPNDSSDIIVFTAQDPEHWTSLTSHYVVAGRVESESLRQVVPDMFGIGWTNGAVFVYSYETRINGEEDLNEVSARSFDLFAASV
jgi:hypothetical protein